MGTAVLGWQPPASAAVGAPGNLRVTGVTYDAVSLAWDPAGGSVAYYQILRDGRWVNSSYGTTGSVRFLAPGGSYTFEVRARDSAGNVSAPAAVTATTKADTRPPTTPANLRVVTGAGGTPTGLAWDAATDDRGVGFYRLLANGSDAFGGGQAVDFLSLTDVLCTVQSGQTYTFTVQAMDLSGNASPTGTPLTVTVP